jgi:tRNA pseudouridine55 synthase
VRSIARDLGEQLGCGGYLHALRRTEAAGLAASEARTPSELEALAREGRLDEALVPLEQLVDLPQLVLNQEQARRFGNGGELPKSGEGRVLVRGPSGVLGVGLLVDGVLHPQKVLAEPSA